jgi:hypothetical protein
MVFGIAGRTEAPRLSTRFGRGTTVLWRDYVLIGLLLLLLGRRFIPPHWWYLSPAKRRAMRAALRAASTMHQAEVDWSNCWIRRRDREKCFVFLQHEIIGRPEPFSVFVVWDESGQVDDLGTWVFHWGLFWPDQPIEAYERCRAAGVAWPVGLQAWLEWARQFPTEYGEIVAPPPPP